MTMQRRFFSGDSLAHALNQAAQHFQLTPEEIDYKLVDKRHGFLKVRRKVVIEVDEASPRKEANGGAEVERPAAHEAPRPRAGRPKPRATSARAARAERDAAESSPQEGGRRAESHDAQDDLEPAPAWGSDPEWAGEPGDEAVLSTDAVESDVATEDVGEAEPGAPTTGGRRRRGRRGRGGSRHVELADAPAPARSRYKAAQGEEAEAAAQALEKILKLADLVLESEIYQAEEYLQIELRGADQDLLLRDRGRLLLAIQHLLPRAIRGLIGRSVVCKVDCDNYHEIREERLRDLAQRAADEVRHRGRPKTLEPMSPDERRIVHLTLADYPGVETESHGSGLFKRVMVRSTAGGRSRDRDSSYRR